MSSESSREQVEHSMRLSHAVEFAERKTRVGSAQHALDTDLVTRGLGCK